MTNGLFNKSAASLDMNRNYKKGLFMLMINKSGNGFR